MLRLMLSAAALAVAASAACSPALDWREVRPDGAGGALALFPCKPQSLVRMATLAGGRVQMSLHSCSAGGATYALSFADLAEPSRVTPALAEMRAALAGNVSAAGVDSAAFQLNGMTPNPQAVRLRLQGRLPDGSAAQEQAVLYAKGTRVYQAAVLGATLRGETADAFFDGLKLPP